MNIHRPYTGRNTKKIRRKKTPSSPQPRMEAITITELAIHAGLVLTVMRLGLRVMGLWFMIRVRVKV